MPRPGEQDAPGEPADRPSSPRGDDRLQELVAHLQRTTPLGRKEAERVVEEVLAFFDEPLEDYVRRRHAELQRQGLRNDRIYDRIRSELRWWRLAAPPLSERQVRRIVYG